jgi:hypothetical protein
MQAQLIFAAKDVLKKHDIPYAMFFAQIRLFKYGVRVFQFFATIVLSQQRYIAAPESLSDVFFSYM